MECPICLIENIELIESPCTHKVCVECWKKLDNYSCPLCRLYLKGWLCKKQYQPCKIICNTECNSQDKSICINCRISHFHAILDKIKNKPSNKISNIVNKHPVLYSILYQNASYITNNLSPYPEIWINSYVIILLSYKLFSESTPLPLLNKFINDTVYMVYLFLFTLIIAINFNINSLFFLLYTIIISFISIFYSISSTLTINTFWNKCRMINIIDN